MNDSIDNNYSKALFCQSCLDEIISFGEPALNIYTTVCEYKTTYKKYLVTSGHGLTPHGLTVLKFLENRGFVITSECGKDFIFIMPNGYIVTYEDNTKEFCCCKINHIIPELRKRPFPG